MTQTNQIWAMDFVQEQLSTGRNIWILTVVDTFWRFSPSAGHHQIVEAGL